MKKLFEAIGVISLVCLSFLYTEKTVDVVKEYDDIMIEIKKQNGNYKLEAIDATIKGNTIIPGINGKQINEDKSYSKMKRYGKFNSSLLEYEEVEPKISINDNKDKYIISGNSKKNMVSLIFLVEENTNVNKILTILDTKDKLGNFFIDYKWLEQNEDLLLDIINKGHVVGNLKMENTEGNYSWTDTMIKKIGNQKNGYCYTTTENEMLLKICAASNNYTIFPNIVTNNYPLKEIKDNLKSGSIIALKVNDITIKELNLIINYIDSKGYQIVTLKEQISEDNNL